MGKNLFGFAAALLAFSASAAVCVNDFGAIPNDGKDDTQAVKKALQHALQTKDKELVFKEGQYDFFQAHPKHYLYLFQLRNVKGLTVSGTADKTRLLFHGSSFLVMAHDSENITFRNLTMDYSRPHFSLGTVTSVAPDERSFET